MGIISHSNSASRKQWKSPGMKNSSFIKNHGQQHINLSLGSCDE